MPRAGHFQVAASKVDVPEKSVRGPRESPRERARREKPRAVQTRARYDALDQIVRPVAGGRSVALEPILQRQKGVAGKHLEDSADHLQEATRAGVDGEEGIFVETGIWLAQDEVQGFFRGLVRVHGTRTRLRGADGKQNGDVLGRVVQTSRGWPKARSALGRRRGHVVIPRERGRSCLISSG